MKRWSVSEDAKQKRKGRDAIRQKQRKSAAANERRRVETTDTNRTKNASRVREVRNEYVTLPSSITFSRSQATLVNWMLDRRAAFKAFVDALGTPVASARRTTWRCVARRRQPSLRKTKSRLDRAFLSAIRTFDLERRTMDSRDRAPPNGPHAAHGYARRFMSDAFLFSHEHLSASRWTRSVDA